MMVKERERERESMVHEVYNMGGGGGVLLWSTYYYNIQCNLIYPEPRLSGLARDLKIHYHACAEGVTDDLLWVWL